MVLVMKTHGDSFKGGVVIVIVMTMQIVFFRTFFSDQFFSDRDSYDDGGVVENSQ